MTSQFTQNDLAALCRGHTATRGQRNALKLVEELSSVRYPTALTDTDLADLAWQFQAMGYSPSTVLVYMRHLKAALRLAMHRGRLRPGPDLTLSGRLFQPKVKRLTVPSEAEERCAYIPTPAEIAEACRDVQAEWGEAERRSRRGWRKEFTEQGVYHYTVPESRSRL